MSEASGGASAMPQDVKACIVRMRSLADSAMEVSYEVECQRAMRAACVLLENAYRAIDWIKANKGAHPENIAKVIEQCMSDSSGVRALEGK